MNKVLTLILIVGVVFGLTGCIGPNGNRPPSIPSISIPVEATVNEEVKITVRSVDQDRDKLTYRVRFGDGIEAWSEYHPSGQEVTFTYEYKVASLYEVTARAYDGKAVSEWSEIKWIKVKTDLPPPVPRLMRVLGTCLPGCEQMWLDNEGDYFYGNREGWPNYDEAERLGMKVFINIRTDKGLTEEFIKSKVLEYKDRPVCGGWWSDQLGHEPDICGQPLEERIWFYNTVRKYDPGDEAIQKRPVMEMFNCTGVQDFAEASKTEKVEKWIRENPELAKSRMQSVKWVYPGWENAFDEKTHDVLMIDLYAGGETDEDVAREITRLFRKFIVPFNKNKQLVPQVKAFDFRPGSIWIAYNTWKRLLSSEEYDNPYRGQPFSLAYYCDLAIRESAEMQAEIREVNIRIGEDFAK